MSFIVRKILSFCFFFFFLSSSALAGKIEGENLEISYDFKTMTGVAIVSGLSAEKEGKREEKEHLDNFHIMLDDESKHIHNNHNKPDDNTDSNFNWTNKEFKQEIKEADLTLKIKFEIIGVSKSLKEIVGSEDDKKNKIKLKFSYKPEGDQFESSDFYAVRSFSAPKESPDSLKLVAGHKSLIISWDGSNKDVMFTDKSSKPVSEVLLMVFKPGEAHNLSLTSLKLNTENGVNTKFDGTCRYVGGETCIVCDDDEKMSISAEQDNDGVKFIKTKNDGTFTLNDLIPGEEYTVAIQYMNGVARSSCKAELPIRTLTLSEMNGEPEGTLGDPRCFIATAAYGSNCTKELMVLRWFRSEILLSSSIGKKIVASYYKHSPYYAKKISHSESAKTMVRAVLFVPVKLIEGFKSIFEYFEA